MVSRGVFIIIGVIAGFLLSGIYQAFYTHEGDVVVGGNTITGNRPVESAPVQKPVYPENKGGVADSGAGVGGVTQVKNMSPGQDRDVVDPYLLVKRFPDNLALPPLTDEERIRKMEERKERNLRFGKISANKANREEIQAYYKNQKRLSEDSIQLLEFVIDEYGEQLDDRSMRKHLFLLAQFKKRLAHIPKKKAEALERFVSTAQSES